MSNQVDVIHELTMLYLQKTVPTDRNVHPGDIAREYTRASKLIRENIFNPEGITDEEYEEETKSFW